MQRPSSPESTTSAARSSVAPAAWFTLDVALVLFFAISGRSTHERGLGVGGVLETAWPFLAAYVVAALTVRSWRSPSSIRPTGLGLWLLTAVGGLLLRALSGAGTAFSFQVVTVLVLGAFLLVPRGVASLARRRGSGRVA